MAIHFKEFADYVVTKYLNPDDPFVVEIGSNDGIMLQHFREKGIRHLGVEPSANVAEVAIKKGINTISEFFDENLAREIVGKYGQADVFLGANVMCHIPYIHSIIEGIKVLLKPDGIVMFEDPYMGDVIENTSYDQFYDEHVFLFSVLSISYLFEQHSMEVIDVEPQWSHGGSMRYVIARKGARPVSKNVHEHLEKEKALGLDKPLIYDRFKRNCEDSRDALTSLLKEIKKEGKRVVGYAATSKSTTILNYCGIGSDLIEFISDTTPIKQGKFSPGAHVPVRPYEEFKAKYPDYALLFAYNHAREIMAKEQKFVESGGKWIVYVPEVKVL
jgi:methylation protein EvaC